MKINELRQISKIDREKKLKDLKLELIKSKGKAAKTGSSKTREIRKMIARIMTLNKSHKEELKNK